MNHDRPLVLVLGRVRYTLQACVSLGVDAVVVSGAKAQDDGFVEVPDGLRVLPVDDQSSPEAILMALHRAHLADRPFAAVVTSDEFSLVTCALLARHLGCRAAVEAGTALYFRDKYLQKRAVSAAGIKTARVTLIDDIFDVSHFAELPYARAVLKPVAGASTEATSVVESVDELRERSRRHRAAGLARRTFALEEFVSGEEWIADGVVFDGEVVFSCLGKYGDPCLTVIDAGLPLWMRRLDPKADAWAYERAEPVVRRALRVLGLRDGVFHMELFHDPASGEVVFSECAARRGGGLIHEETQAKFNVDLGEAMLLCALGHRPSFDVKTRPGTIGSAYLLGRPGTLVGCPSRAELLALPGVEYARVDVPLGTRLDAGTASTDQKIAQVMVAARSEEDLVRRFAEIRDWFDRRLVVIPPAATGRELRAWQRESEPTADFGDTLWR